MSSNGCSSDIVRTFPFFLSTFDDKRSEQWIVSLAGSRFCFHETAVVMVNSSCSCSPSIVNRGKCSFVRVYFALHSRSSYISALPSDLSYSWRWHREEKKSRTVPPTVLSCSRTVCLNQIADSPPPLPTGRCPLSGFGSGCPIPSEAYAASPPPPHYCAVLGVGGQPQLGPLLRCLMHWCILLWSSSKAFASWDSNLTVARIQGSRWYGKTQSIFWFLKPELYSYFWCGSYIWYDVEISVVLLRLSHPSKSLWLSLLAPSLFLWRSHWITPGVSTALFRES